MFGQRSCCLLLFLTIRTRSGMLCIFETTITSTMRFIPIHCRRNNAHPTICRRIFFFISKAPPSNLHSQTSETHIASLLQEVTQSRSGPSVTIARSLWPSKGVSTSSNTSPYCWPTQTANQLPCLQAQTRCIPWSRMVDVGNLTMSVSSNRDCVHAHCLIDNQ